MAPSALESVSRSFESSLDWWGWFILASTAIVAIGLVVEYWEPVREFIDECRRPAAAFPWYKFMGLAGGILVTVGVFGEFWGAYKASRVETKLRENNHKIEESLNLSAETAATAAARAKASADEAKQKADAVSKQADALTLRMEEASRQLGQLEKGIATQGPRSKLLAKAAPELARKLTPFAGQRVGLFVCGQQGAVDQETLDAWGAIANILGTDTVSGIAGAKWKLVPTNLNFTQRCGGAKGLGQGIIVFVSKRASRSTMEAANILGHGLAKTLPPSPNKMPSLIDPDFAKLTVDRGFQDKNAPWVLPGTDPDLITILIGEHP